MTKQSVDKAISAMTFPTEHQEAVLLTDWARFQAILDPRLELFFAIPNGGHRNPSVGLKLKHEGVKPGVPDYFLACPCNGYSGLFIELKTLIGKANPVQKKWVSDLNQQGYLAVIAKGADEAIRVIEQYLTQPKGGTHARDKA
jgi:hypothetical protein